jgi:hypothetical protein
MEKIELATFAIGWALAPSVGPPPAKARPDCGEAIFCEPTSADLSRARATENVHGDLFRYRHPVYSRTPPHGETDV